MIKARLYGNLAESRLRVCNQLTLIILSMMGLAPKSPKPGSPDLSSWKPQLSLITKVILQLTFKKGL